MRYRLIIWKLLFLLPVVCIGQDYSVRPLGNINSPADEIISTVIGDSIVFCTTQKQDLVNDYQWDEHYVFRQEIAPRENTFESYGEAVPFLHRKTSRDEGPSCYVPEDGVLYFSSAINYSDSKGSNLKIFKTRWNGTKWTEPKLLSFCDPYHNYAHPFYDAQNKMMVFSSDRWGTMGGMDIWIIYKTEDGWTDPVNPGIMINTRYQEIFPTLMDGDIYYASNGKPGLGGYDLFKALKKDQYTVSVQLGIPLNSTEDDVRILFLNEEKGFLTSNRKGGFGGDDIYLFELEPSTEEFPMYTAVLEKQGIPVPSIAVNVKNSLGEVIIEDTTSANGVIDLRPLRLSQEYKLKLLVPDISMYAGSVLKVYDIEGRLVQTIFMNPDGTFEFELLPFDTTINRIAQQDNTLLKIRLRGQVFNDIPGDVGDNEMISIVDEKGEVVAVAYTREAGKFDFNNLHPRLNYVFRLSGESEINHVVVFDKGEKLLLPVLKEEAVYHRLRADEAIRIVNENNQTLYISPKDVFVVNRIYYSYNSSQLSEQAQEQLEQLAEILARNPRLYVDMISYTDSRGTDHYNQLLSDKRAESVINYLVKKGISRSRMTGKGMGEKGLLNDCAENCSEQEHAINRRTEIHLSEKDPVTGSSVSGQSRQ